MRAKICFNTKSSLRESLLVTKVFQLYLSVCKERKKSAITRQIEGTNEKGFADSLLCTRRVRICLCFPKETEVRTIIEKYEELRWDFFTDSSLPCKDSVVYLYLLCSEGHLHLYEGCGISFAIINYFANRLFSNCVIITAPSNSLCCNGTLFEVQRFILILNLHFICTSHFGLAI